MELKDIHTKHWQLGFTADVVTDIDDIKQCIDTILQTRKGSDPLRPHFGCSLMDYIDMPVNRAIPKMKKEILEALREFEPRITITKIEAAYKQQ